VTATLIEPRPFLHSLLGEAVAERFWSKVDLTGVCWEWTRGLTDDGYGKFWYNGAARRAHRIAWMLLVAPELPDDLVADHLCRNRLCVCPDHIEWVTPDVNTLRGFGPAALAARVTHCPQDHEYAGDNLIVRVQQGRERRECRTCVNEQKRARRARALAKLGAGR